MKKLLLGTSALIGATAIVASASAAPELTISGNLDFRLVGGDRPVNNLSNFGAATRLGADNAVGGTDNDADNANPTLRFKDGVTAPSTNANDFEVLEVGASNNGWDFTRANSRSEIRFHAEGESDGGLTYGARIDYRYFQEGGQKTDEAYIFISGDWGTFHLGDDDGVLDARVPNAGSIAPGAYLIDDTTTFINQETNGGNGDDTKVSYFSRNLNGFQFGISAYEAVGDFEDIYELAASYDGEAWGVGYTVALGYQVGDYNTVGSAAATNDDLAEYVFGFKLNYGDISVAGSYNDAGDSGNTLNDTRQEARTYYSLGVAYDLGGGMAIGVSYGEEETTADNATGAAGDRSANLTTFDFGFPVMPGMAGYAGIARSEVEIGTGNNNSIDATTYLVGTTVSF